jgi:hypothetical protein
MQSRKMNEMLKITAIFTVKETTLTITTSEALQLEQLGRPNEPIALRWGVNKVVVQEGVFRVLSMQEVTVIGDTPELHVSAGDKDGPPPSLSKFAIRANDAAVREFLTTARSEPAPT